MKLALTRQFLSNNEIDRKALIKIGLYYLQGGLKEAINKYTDFLFGRGDAAALTALDNLLSEGEFVTGNESNFEDWSSLTVQNNTMRLLYAWLIPTAWSLAQRPAVVIDAGDCAPGTGQYEWITSSTAEETGGCIDGRQYFLVTTAVEWESETPNCFCASPCMGGPPPCWTPGSKNYFLPPPGNDKLRQEGGIQNVTQADMLEG